MKHILLASLMLCTLTPFAQQKMRVNPIVIKQDKLKKKEPVRLDSIQLKPPKGGGTSTPPSEILYDNDQIKAVVNEALDYYEKDFASEQIVALVKNKYSPSLAQVTRIMYNAYMLNYHKVRLDSPWPYDLQLIVSKAYGSSNLATPILLKQGGDKPFMPFVYFYFYFLSLMDGMHDVELAAKMSDHFKLCIEAGYTLEEVYAGSFERTNIDFGIERTFWIPYFVMGMKKAKVPVQNLISVFRTWGLYQYSGTINELLLKGGYTQTEINNATK